MDGSDTSFNGGTASPKTGQRDRAVESLWMPSSHPRAARFVRAGLFDSVASFQELEARISALGDERSLDVGDAFEIFVEAYLRTQVLLQADQVWLVGQVPLDVRRALNLPADAKGIDGVFRTRTAEHVPYQVKFRSARARLSFTEVAPFLGVTDRATDRLLFTNANALADDAAKRDGLRTLRGTDFDALTPADFKSIADWLQARPVRPERATPRDDQVLAVANLTATLQTYDRATVVMACGTGKTLVQLWAAEALGAQRLLVLVPSLSLIQQTLTEWSRHTQWGERFRYLCVCSDPTVTDSVDQWDPLVMTQAELGFRVDTDASVVRDFLTAPHDGVSVVFSTYQSAPVVSDGSRGCPPFDLGIFDEAHKTTGPRGGMFAYALTDANLLIRKRAFFTATPRHYLQTRDREGDFKVVSMDDPALYGPIAHELSFAAAVAAGIICDYRVVLSVVDPAEVSAFALQHGITLVKGDLQATAWVASQIALAHAITETRATKVITFHSRVAHAQVFASDTERGIGQYLDAFTVSHVNGSQSTADRRDTLSGFRDERCRLVTNARCLTEGVDLPAVDMVAFINPRKSKVDIVQAAGRAMRKPRDGDKEFGYIVVPVLLTYRDGHSLEEACQQTDWADVIDVLAALRESDTRLVDVIAELQQARGRGEVFNPRPLQEHIQVIGPQVDLDVLQRSIDSIVVDRLGVSWDEMYGRLQAFNNREGHVNVPRGHSDDFQLGAWCNKQRYSRRKGTLAVERIAKLDELRFEWEPFGAAWDEMYGQLQGFGRREGHVNVPAEYPDGPSLGTWCSNQRTAMNAGVLPVERIARLEALGFVWEPHDAAWDEMYGRLRAFKAREGHAEVPHGYSADPKLSSWCGTQRTLKRGGRLSAERVSGLDELGFVWNPRDSVWDEMYGRLQVFSKRKGHARVPVEYAKDPILGRWCNKQRQSKKEGTLSSERIMKLSALSFVWDLLGAKWDQMYRLLQEFWEREGHVNVPRGLPPDRLGSWCDTQRQFKKKGRLIEDRILKLEALGFEWEPRDWDAAWEEMYGQLQAFTARERHARVPPKYPADPPLGTWSSNQRTSMKKGALSAERIARLEALGFVWDLHDATWEEMCQRLRAFKARAGHTDLPAKYPADPQLGRWCSRQRQSKKKGRLSVERIAKLDKLEFAWEPFNATWDAMWLRLQAFRTREGHVNMPVEYSADPPLGAWCTTQRAFRRRGTMSAERISRLDALGFVWEPSKDKRPKK